MPPFVADDWFPLRAVAPSIKLAMPIRALGILVAFDDVHLLAAGCSRSHRSSWLALPLGLSCSFLRLPGVASPAEWSLCSRKVLRSSRLPCGSSLLGRDRKSTRLNS